MIHDKNLKQKSRDTYLLNKCCMLALRYRMALMTGLGIDPASPNGSNESERCKKI